MSRRANNRATRRARTAFTTVVSPLLLSYDFTGATLGNLGTLSSSYAGLNLTRASAATVQTSASALDSTPSTDQARIGSTGAAWGRGLVIEESRTNYATGARTIPTNWPIAGSGVTYTASQSSPDGTSNAVRVQLSGSGTFSNYQATGATAGVATFYSEWARGTSTSQSHNLIMGNGGSASNAFVVNTSTTWQRFTSNAYAANNPSQAIIPVDAEYNSIGAVDVVLDFCQVELGSFPTEAIVTAGATATRAGDRVFVTSAATMIDTNRMGLAFRFIAKGTPAQYSANAFIWYIDASNNAWIDTSQKVNVKLGGTTVTSASAISWAAGDVVDLWVACGAGSNAVVEYRVNSGATTTLLNTALAGNPSGAGNIDIFCSGTSNQLSAWLQSVSAYKTGQQPSWVV